MTGSTRSGNGPDGAGDFPESYHDIDGEDWSDEDYDDEGYGDEDYGDEDYGDEDYDDGVVDDGDVRFADDPGPTPRGPSPGRRYRPGRGGFDPEAAEIAARAKYAFRQRVVFFLLLSIVVTAVIGGFVWSAVWWLHGASDLALASYLVYLRKQGRIEEEIRQRRLARFHDTTRRAPQHDEQPADPEDTSSDSPGIVGAERDPVPTSRTRRQAVVVDSEEEDPAFHELGEPEWWPYRRAAGE